MKNILFLCTGNYYRSRLAEEYFNHLAELHQFKMKASSRGFNKNMAKSKNKGNLAKEVLEILAGIKVQCHSQHRKPESVISSDLQDADYIFALDKTEHQPMVDSNFSDFSVKINYLDVADVHEEPVYVAVVKLIKQIDALFDNFLNMKTP